MFDPALAMRCVHCIVIIKVPYPWDLFTVRYCGTLDHRIHFYCLSRNQNRGSRMDILFETESRKPFAHVLPFFAVSCNACTRYQELQERPSTKLFFFGKSDEQCNAWAHVCTYLWGFYVHLLIDSLVLGFRSLLTWVCWFSGGLSQSYNPSYHHKGFDDSYMALGTPIHDGWKEFPSISHSLNSYAMPWFPAHPRTMI